MRTLPPSAPVWLGLLLAALAGTAPAPAAEPSADWAFHPLGKANVPAVRQRQAVRNPVDAFLLAGLEARGLSFAPEADRATLIRRLSFDLTGLPPTPEEVADFEKDTAPDAYEKLVDRMLASPGYGERQALWWLDLVRYAETDGFKADDDRPDAWRYRDYVIDAFNTDKPFDRFVREQLAGDEFYPDDPAAVIATGFLRLYPDEYNAANLEQRRQEILNDVTDTTAATFLGVTVACARCHDHKFDPISQEDYYRLQAFFAGVTPADVPALSAEERRVADARRAEWENRTAAARRKIEELERPVREKFAADRLKRFPAEYQEWVRLPAGKRTPHQEIVTRMAALQMRMGGDAVGKQMKGPAKDEWTAARKELDAVPEPRVPTAMACRDLGSAVPTTFLLKRGDWNKRGDEIAPGFLSAIDDREAECKPPRPGTTGRRSALAEWLTRPDHPLTTRAIVNRLWQQHFGRGLVATTADLGAQGERPTHPELLDWLACELVRGGWSLKKVSRLMVTSAAYRQSAKAPPAALEKDPDNRLLGRMPRRRLDGEALRDAILAVSGELNRKAGGPSVYPELPAEVKSGKWPVSVDASERNRRSIYVAVRRNLRYPLFALFDAPDRNETCSRRYATTTAPQSLALLNDDLVRRYARSFADRVLRESSAEPAKQTERAFRLATGRSPDATERKLLLGYLSAERARDGAAALGELCHALLNLNEFVYVD